MALTDSELRNFSGVLGGIIRRRRTNQIAKQYELADLLSFNHTWICRVEKGERVATIKVTQFIALCDALDLDPVVVLADILNAAAPHGPRSRMTHHVQLVPEIDPRVA